MNNLIFDLGDSLSVRPIAMADAAALASLVRDNISHLEAFLPVLAQLASEEQAAAQLKRGADAFAANVTLEWHIFEHGVLCGAVRVKDIDPGSKSAALGYYLGQQFQGRGIATSAVLAVIDYCFADLELNRIELKCAVGNTQSAALAKRIGFTLEGVMRQAEYLHGEFVDHQLFSLLRQEF
ncbi:GNAT family N-acetyltransferase [Oxalobacteraceae bacterium]|nr:GNAT family N-acetyltransferase [Oxalobacteraceae bacterium]